MKDIDKIYKQWCGASRIENSCKQVHDSTEMIEFTEYYIKENQPEPTQGEDIQRHHMYLDNGTIEVETYETGKWYKVSDVEKVVRQNKAMIDSHRLLKGMLSVLQKERDELLKEKNDTTYPEEYVVLAKGNFLHKDGSIVQADQADINGRVVWVANKKDLKH